MGEWVPAEEIEVPGMDSYLTDWPISGNEKSPDAHP